MVKRQAIVIVSAVAIATVAVVVWLCSWLDARTIAQRRSKIHELAIAADILNADNPSLPTVLLRFGSPKMITTERLPVRPGTPTGNMRYRLTLRYQYRFRGLPWDSPDIAELVIHFEGTDALKLSAAGTGQTWR
jgi:hypothetical protein